MIPVYKLDGATIPHANEDDIVLFGGKYIRDIYLLNSNDLSY